MVLPERYLACLSSSIQWTFVFSLGRVGLSRRFTTGVERRQLHFLGRRVTGEDQKLIQDVIADCDGLSRMELARTVCELLGWKRRNGSLKGRECREFLEKLEAAGLLVLPEKRAGRPVGSRTAVPVTELGSPGAVIQTTAHELDRLELELVESDDARRLFRELVGRYHYLGHAVPFPARHGGSQCATNGSDGTMRPACAISAMWSITAGSSCCRGSKSKIWRAGF